MGIVYDSVSENISWHSTDKTNFQHNFFISFRIRYINEMVLYVFISIEIEFNWIRMGIYSNRRFSTHSAGGNRQIYAIDCLINTNHNHHNKCILSIRAYFYVCMLLNVYKTAHRHTSAPIPQSIVIDRQKLNEVKIAIETNWKLIGMNMNIKKKKTKQSTEKNKCNFKCKHK